MERSYSKSTQSGAAPGSVAVPYPSIFRMADRVVYGTCTTVGWIIVQSRVMHSEQVRFQYNFISTCMLFSAEIRSISESVRIPS